MEKEGGKREGEMGEERNREEERESARESEKERWRKSERERKRDRKLRGCVCEIAHPQVKYGNTTMKQQTARSFCRGAAYLTCEAWVLAGVLCTLPGRHEFWQGCCIPYLRGMSFGRGAGHRAGPSHSAAGSPRPWRCIAVAPAWPSYTDTSQTPSLGRAGKDLTHRGERESGTLPTGTEAGRSFQGPTGLRASLKGWLHIIVSHCKMGVYSRWATTF